MSEKSGFFLSHGGDRIYTPDWLAEYIKALVSSGVYNTELGVKGGGGMMVTVEAGRAWLEGYLYQLTAPMTLPVATADPSRHRKDNVVVRLDMTNRTANVKIIKGTPSSNPKAPDVVRTADTYDLKVAEIYVAAGSSQVLQQNITDTRLNDDVCGITVCTVQHIPTAAFLEQMTADFMAWFEEIKGILGQDEAGRLLQMIQALQQTVSNNYTELSNAISEMQTTIMQDLAISDKTLEALGLQKGAKLDDALYAAGKHIVLDITFTAGFVGRQYQITGAGLKKTVTGTVPSGGEITVPVLETACQYKLTCNGRTMLMDVGDYYGAYKFMLAPPLAEADPATIGEVAAAGMAKVAWNVGDEINVALSGGETVTLQIYDFDHDTMVSGGMAPITFGMKNCMRDKQQMNSGNTNVNGWPGSAMYSYLNTTIYNKLPQAWKNIIKPVKKLTSAGNQSKSIQSSNDKLFLFCEEEIFGGTTYGVAGEGKQYPIFTDNNSRIKKENNGTGAAAYWWERSPSASNAAYFCTVDTGGTASYSGASGTRGVAFGFCV